MSKLKNTLVYKIWQLFFRFALPTMLLVVSCYIGKVYIFKDIKFKFELGMVPYIVGTIIYLIFILLTVSPIFMLFAYCAREKSKFSTVIAIIATAISVFVMSIFIITNVLEDEIIYAWLIVLIINSIVLALNGASFWDVGKFAEDTTYVSGSHMEITFDSNGKGTIREVNDYGGDSGLTRNGFLFMFRFLAVLFGGIIIFIVKLKKFLLIRNENRV